MIYEEWTQLTWSHPNKKLYVSKGYEFTGYGTIFKVKVSDLTNGSHAIIKLQCDNDICDNTWEVYYYSYLKSKEKVKNKCDFCSDCLSIKIKETYREKQEEFFVNIQKTFKVREYNLLSTFDDYHGSGENLYFTCNLHLDKGILCSTWDKVKRGGGCKYCGRESAKKKQSLGFDFVKDEFNRRNYILLGNQYLNSKSPMDYICSIHPNEIQTTIYDYIRDGNGGCRFCVKEKISGENHWNWQGGVSSLHEYLRQKLTDWKFESLRHSNFKCIITGSNKELEVHHLYSFSSILKETLNQLNFQLHSNINKYTNNELTLIEEKCLELHYFYGLGVVLTKEIHIKFHSIYGYGNNAPEQFEEFKNNYVNNLII